MNDNQKKFGIYVFLSTFARNLIELFIPIILYKYGYSLREVIFYYLMVNIFALIIDYPNIKIAKKYNNRILAIIGFISFSMLQLLLNNMKNSLIYLIFVAFLYAVYRRGYWISRRFYNLKIVTKEKISSTYSLISIINQIGTITSSYIGSLFLDFLSIDILTIISLILYIISIIPLFLLKFEHEKNNIKLDFIGTIKKIPKTDLYLFGSSELLDVLKVLFSLYLFIYVKDNYQTIGIMNLLTNVAVITFAYVYGKKIEGNKNFLKISILLLVLTLLLKANCTTYLLICISFIEGIFTKMHELSISKEFYVMSKKFEYSNYNLVYEIVQNFSRGFVALILLIFISDLKKMIYVVLGFIIVGIFFDFKQINCKNFKTRD